MAVYVFPVVCFCLAVVVFVCDKCPLKEEVQLKREIDKRIKTQAICKMSLNKLHLSCIKLCTCVYYTCTCTCKFSVH